MPDADLHRDADVLVELVGEAKAAIEEADGAAERLLGDVRSLLAA
jgi:hypothetical protein